MSNIQTNRIHQFPKSVIEHLEEGFIATFPFAETEKTYYFTLGVVYERIYDTDLFVSFKAFCGDQIHELPKSVLLYYQQMLKETLNRSEELSNKKPCQAQA